MSYANLRDAAAAELNGWRPPSACQEQLRSKYLNELRTGPATLQKSAKAHLTASCLVFDTSNDHVLLHLHRKAGAWLQFGGHLEPDDPSLRAAAAREANEESGTDQVILTPAIWQLNHHLLTGAFGRCREHLDVAYLGTIDAQADVHVSSESLDVAWFPLDDLPPTIADDLPPRIRAARAVLDQPAGSSTDGSS